MIKWVMLLRISILMMSKPLFTSKMTSKFWNDSLDEVDLVRTSSPLKNIPWHQSFFMIQISYTTILHALTSNYSFFRLQNWNYIHGMLIEGQQSQVWMSLFTIQVYYTTIINAFTSSLRNSYDVFRLRNLSAPEFHTRCHLRRYDSYRMSHPIQSQLFPD